MLKVENLRVAFEDSDHDVIKGLSFELKPGEILGIVGESGSGKSLTALSILGLLKKGASVREGEIWFKGESLLSKTEEEMSSLRGAEISMIFQEPMTSLNPVLSVGQQLMEPLRIHEHLSQKELRLRALQMMADVGLTEGEELLKKYPHQLSGGMRQRVLIAQSMMASPSLLIADEPTTALDTVLQAQILTLLKQIQRATGISILFISHDLDVIRAISDRVLVLRKGVKIEEGETNEVFLHPKHEYTKTLLESFPSVEQSPSKETILSLQNVDIFYKESHNDRNVLKHACKKISMDIERGEILGLIGESGSGKTSIARVIAGLNKRYEGRIVGLEKLRIGYVFQDPYSSLNPARTIRWILREAVRVSSCEYSLEEMMEQVGLRVEYLDRYPKELSGGERQRVCLAMALLCDHDLIIMDEAVSALDVTVSNQILRLILSLHKRKAPAILFITHDMALAEKMCHYIYVLKNGEIIEEGGAKELFEHPKDLYTQKLVTLGGVKKTEA